MLDSGESDRYSWKYELEHGEAVVGQIQKHMSSFQNQVVLMAYGSYLRPATMHSIHYYFFVFCPWHV
jgi:hypothetical protein